jgi:hypothetical protein
LSDKGDVSLYVDTGRAGQLAGSDTVAIVFFEEQFEHELAHLPNLLRVGGNHHIFFYFGTARRRKVRLSFYLDDTQPTAFDGSEDLVVT